MIQKYTRGEGEYKWHNDFLCNKQRLRVFTFIWYLNTVEEGGETEFTDSTRVKPEQGKLVFFPACWSLKHRGCMPLSCDKYIITGWIYGDNPNRGDTIHEHTK
jgi:2OG-Fe(II) oxygenase superfamily